MKTTSPAFTDTYLTINTPITDVLFKEKNSKFFGNAFPVTSEEEVKGILENLRKMHTGAGHFCYAYQLGTTTFQYRVNDDGEPKNSGGMPIYGQIQSFKITNVLVVVIRYFGGVRLGVGGLISAYKTTAQLALNNAEIIEKIINVQFKLQFEYENADIVMRIIKEKKLQIIFQKMEEDCEMVISTRQKNAKNIFDVFESVSGVKII